MPVRVTHQRWGQFRNLVLREQGRRLRACGRLIRYHLVGTISFQGSYHPPFHSLPGDPPYRQTGDLIRSWKYEVDTAALAMRVSSDSPYVLALEFGAPQINLEPRPHARSAFYSQVYHCAAILGAPM